MSSATLDDSPIAAEMESPWAGWMALWRPRSLLRADILASGLLIPVTIAACLAWGIRPNLDIGEYVLVAAALFLVVTIPTFVVFAIRCRIWGRPASIHRRLCFGTFLINVIALVVMSWIGTHIKAGVLLGAVYDEQLRTMERAFLGGREAWAVLQSVIPRELAAFFALIYWMFKPLILATILWLVLTCKTRKANQVTCAIILGYYIGTFAYHLLPSYGPAYIDPAASPEAFNPGMAYVQQVLLHHTREVQQDPGNAVIMPWKYIGAFPSLHLSHVLILAWYMRYTRLGLTFYGFFSLCTAVSTIYFGWHYLIDLVGGVVVAALAIWITQKSQALLHRAPAQDGDETITAASR